MSSLNNIETKIKSKSQILMKIGGMFLLFAVVFVLAQIVLAQDNTGSFKIKDSYIEVQETSYPEYISLVKKEAGKEEITGQIKIVDQYLISDLPENEFLDEFSYLKSGFQDLSISLEVDQPLFNKENFHHPPSLLDKTKTLFGFATLPEYRITKEIDKSHSVKTELDLKKIKMETCYKELGSESGESRIKQTLAFTNDSGQDLNLSLLLKSKISPNANKIYWNNAEYAITETPQKFVNPDRISFEIESGKAFYDFSDIPDEFEPELWVEKKSETSLIILSISVSLSAGETKIIDPTYEVEITILNVHSHPQVGDNWTVSFETKGTADLTITPDDQQSINDLDFVSLKCGKAEKIPQILENDVIFYPNWFCPATGTVTHLVNVTRKHTLKFQFGDQIAHAYNSPGMKQVIIGGYDNALHATTTEYNTLAGGFIWISTASRAKQVVSTPGTLSNLLVELVASPGAGKSYTITLMINGTATALAVTISGTDTTGLDTDSVVVVAGDVIQLRCVPSGTPTARVARWSVLFEGTNANESLILGTTECLLIADNYSPISHGRNDSGSKTYTYQIIPTPGKIKNLYVALSADPGTPPEAYRFTLLKNGESTALTVTITADATTGNNTADEITVAAGDYVNLMIERVNGPTANANVALGFTFVADTDGESLLLGQSSDSPTTTQTEYNHLVSTKYDLAWGTTEANFYQGGQPMTLKKLYVKLSGAPGAGKSYLIGARVNGTTRLSVTIADAATTGSDLVNTWDVANFDDLNMICTPSGTPAGKKVYWGLVGCITYNHAPTVSTITDDSTSDSPTNVGENVIFSGEISDPDDADQIALLICTTDAVSAGACSVAQWCRDPASGFKNEDSVSCTYQTQAADAPSKVWYAYACDNDNACTNMAEETAEGTVGTFYVNRAPDFTAVDDTPDPLNPGAQVTITTEASDTTDSDNVKLFVCKTASCTSSGCGGGEWCSAGLTNSNPTCNFNAPTPSEGAQHYYPYIYDEHGFGAE